MMPSNMIFIQLSIVVLFLVTRTATTKVSQSMEEASRTYNDDQHPTPLLTDHQHQTLDDSKPIAPNDDDDLSSSSSTDSDEEYLNDDHRHHHHHQAIWPSVFNKQYTRKMIRAGNSASNGADSRQWAIPYRFGKRAAMPYRFGKRAGMHFRLGKKSASL